MYASTHDLFAVLRILRESVQEGKSGSTPRDDIRIVRITVDFTSVQTPMTPVAGIYSVHGAIGYKLAPWGGGGEERSAIAPAFAASTHTHVCV